MENSNRPLYVIATEIRKDWKKVNYGAVPYLEAMECLNTVNDRFGVEDGKTQVIYFLSNATTWKGEVAKRVKLELKKLAGIR